MASRNTAYAAKRGASPRRFARSRQEAEGGRSSEQEAVVMSENADPGPEQLLQQAKAGDHQALGQMLQRYRAYLAVLARVQIGRRLQGKVDASDVVQEAFLGAY